MSPKSNSGFAAQATPAPVSIAPKGQFDTFETKFFEQGDQGSNQPAEAERFDDLDELPRSRKSGSSRQFVLGVAIGSASVAVLGCLGLWLSGARLATSAPIPATVVAAPAPPAPVAEPAPAPAVAQAEPAPAPPLAVAKVEPASAPAPTPAAPTPAAPTPAAPTPAVAALPAAPQPEEKTEGRPVPAAALAAAEAHEAVFPAAPTPAAPAVEAAEARGKCMETVREKRGKQILSVCALAFDADPGAADIAVLLAKTEFDRGRSAQALAWGKKAIAADPKAAEAYVFIGGAEQNVGHGKAAREAYRRYLELAPTGRYAGDLRAIVGSLK
jgi:hypothetical protein